MLFGSFVIDTVWKSNARFLRGWQMTKVYLKPKQGESGAGVSVLFVQILELYWCNKEVYSAKTICLDVVLRVSGR